MNSINSTEQMTDYLRDESRSIGRAEAVFFPESEADVIQLMREHPDVPVTVQGSRTGLTAGCVPEGGIVLNLSRMNKVLQVAPPPAAVFPGCSGADRPGCCTAVVQPGLPLQTLREVLRGTGLWFPPDPTEASASIGGMIANDSSGARTYKYGSMRQHVRSIRVVLRNGEVLRLSREPKDAGPALPVGPAEPAGTQGTACGRDFVLRTEGGCEIRGRLPELPIPAVSKNVAGYYIRPGMDMIDLFIGSEGTLGIVTEAELILRPVPQQVWGCVVFFQKEKQALFFVEAVRGAEHAATAEAIEYFDHDTLALMHRAQGRGEVLADAVPVPVERCAVYVEYAGPSKEAMLQIFASVRRYILRAGGDPAETWLAAGSSDLARLKEFRHAAPVCVNHVISSTKQSYPQITKLGTDMAVPDGCLRAVFRMYRDGLSGAPAGSNIGAPAGSTGDGRAPGGPRPFRSAIFGHIGDNHVHVNIMPRDSEEYLRGKALFTEWARQVTAMGGSVSAEHGIGKLKRWLLEEMYTREQLEKMRALKKVFDPQELLGGGTMFTPAR